MHTTTLPLHRSRRRARPVAAATLVLATLLAACGGGSDDASDATDETTAPTEATTGSGSDTGTDTGTDTGSDGTDGTDDGSDGATSTVDICAEITQEDMAAILPEATLISAAPNDVVPTPTCDYSIELTGGFEAAVIQILLAAEEPSYLDGQREIQSDAVDVPGLEDAFAYDDFGSILVQGESGVFLVERGVELTEGGTAASQDQMIAIAERVAAL